MSLKDSPFKVACREAFFGAANRLGKGIGHDKVSKEFEEFWDANGDRLEWLASQCEECLIYHDSDEDCADARKRVQDTEADHRAKVHEWFIPIDDYDVSRSRYQVKVPKPLTLRDLPAHATFKFRPDLTTQGLRLAVPAIGQDMYTPPDFADAWASMDRRFHDNEVFAVLLSRADSKDPRYNECAERLTQIENIEKVLRAPPGKIAMIDDDSSDDWLDYPPMVPKTPFSVPSQPAWQCQRYGCPERPPVKSVTAPRCYTCGEAMSRVP